jgi:hypothetical protein
MDDIKRGIKRFPLLPLLAGLSLAVGFLVPPVFELAQKPVSRHKHVNLERTAVVIVVATISWCAVAMLVRGRWPSRPLTITRPKALQFGLRAVFAVMTVTAVVLAVSRALDMPWACAVVVALVLAIAGWSLTGDWPQRARVATLLACTYFPFTWMIAFNRPFGYSSGLAVNLPMGPGILWGVLLSALGRLSLGAEGVGKLAIVFVILQLLVGAWLAWRGGKLFATYLVLALVSSSLSSLVLHVLYRA